MSFEWIFPLVLPFLFGLLIGLFVKQAIKLVTLVIALIALFTLAGVATVTIKDLWEKASRALPTLASWAEGIIGTAPYGIAAFAMGLLIGVWKG
jgi:uncharacterized membrane protein (Fun14 family)